jgi:hypothetical protein
MEIALHMGRRAAAQWRKTWFPFATSCTRGGTVRPMLGLLVHPEPIQAISVEVVAN